MSCTTESWVNGTLEEAIDMLAKRASVARLLRKAVEKKADMSESLHNGMSAISRQIQLNPALASILGGGAVGAGLGGLSSLNDHSERRNPLRSAITGGLSGAAVGGGAYMASRLLPQIKERMAQPADATSFMHNGVTHQLDPAAVRNNPQLLQEIDQLESRSPITKAVGSSWQFLKDYWKNHPILGTIAGADALSHTLGTASNYVNPSPSLNPNFLREGILRHFKAPKENPSPLGGIHGDFESLSSEPNNVLGELLAAAKGKKSPSGNVTLPSGADVSIKSIQDLSALGGSHVRHGGLQSIMDLISPSIERVTGTKPNPLMFTGYTQDANGLVKKAPGWFSEALRYFEHGGGGNPWHLRTNALSRLGPRALLYAGIPAAQEYFRIANQESENSKRLEALIAQLSKPKA